MKPHPLVTIAPDPDNPGWYLWGLPDNGRFHQVLGPLSVKPEGERRATCRMQVGQHHLNLGGAMHGGAILTFVDMALYVAGHAAGAETARAVTLDCNTQFLAPASAGTRLDAQVEIISETGRLIFFRGLIVQGETIVASFSAVLRKGRPAA